MTLRADQYTRIASLTDDQARTILSRHHSLPATDEPATTRLLSLAATRQLDQRSLLLPCFRTQNPLELTAIETIVGRPITRIQKITKHVGPVRPGRPKPPPPDDNRLITQIAPNPKKLGSASYDRFQLYREGMTVTQARAAGVTTGDLKWDSERGFITIC